jgi:putative ATP-binding cassette transporter
LWPWGGGKILYGYGSRLFLLPQRPYIPVGSLRRAAAYPTPPESVDPDVLREVLEAVGLRQFVERLDEEIAWDHVLSGGEKQRLAIARLLIHQPTIIVLDEATSALDQQSQEQMMKLISERLPEATIISVGHRPELEAFHERKLVMESQPSGARLVSDVHLTHAWPVKLPWTWSRGKRAVPAKP